MKEVNGMEIKNMPPESALYEFIVYREVDGEKWFWGAYNDVNRACTAAVEIGGKIWRNGGRTNDTV